MSKYRTALSILSQTAEFMPICDESDLAEIKEVVSALYQSLDLSILEAFLNAT